MESRLVSEISSVSSELSAARRAAAALHAAHAAAARRVAATRQAIQQHQHNNNHQGKKKGKKQKLNPAQQAKLQLVAEQLGELTTLLNTTAKEMQTADKQVIECTRRLQHCERQLTEARAVQGKPERASVQLQQQAEQAALLQKQQQMQEQQHQHLLQQQQQQLQQLHQQQLQQHQLQQQQMQQQQLQQQQLQQQKLHQQKQLEQQRFREIQMEVEKQKMEKQRQKQMINNSNIVCVKRSPGDGAVTVTVPEHHSPLAQLVHNNRHLTVVNVCEPPPPPPPPAPAPKQTDASRKQTWEQALAHINQIAKGTHKEKKKQKEPQAKPEAKVKETQRSNSLPDPQTLSKKQRRVLAKQQAEEEEMRKQQQETKSKKTEPKKSEPVKLEVTKKAEKKVEAKKEPTAVKKKDEKKEKKLEKVVEKKGKENKQEKNAQTPAAKANKQPAGQAQQQSKKDNKKKEPPQKPHVINITPDTTIEVVSKKNQFTNESDKPTSCSIMEQLSCGVQVADLKLPPGITLTRVQPTEKKDPPTIKSVPLWKCSQLPASPTPVARPPPVINADPTMMMFTTAHPEPPKTILIPDPPPPQPQPTGKSKKAKKKAKKAASEAPTDTKVDATKMVTLRNPMFHPNLPPVQITNTPQVQKKAEIRIPDPIPMPPNACQATITPTSNGMYTIRNPLMSMMHQQSMMGIRPQSPQVPMYQPPYNYINPNVYQPAPNQYVVDPTPKPDEFQNRIMNLASFTQKNDEGYSLFKTNEDSNQKNFLTPEFYDAQSPKPVVSPNPIGTRPNNESSRSFDSNDSSLFANPIQRPEPIGTPLKREEERNEYTGLYTPFGQEDRNVFRNALFNDKNDIGSNVGKMDDMGLNHIPNGDSLPYFQRLRVGSKLNNEVTIHHVTESKFYKGQEGIPLEGVVGEESVFCRPHPVWPDPAYIPPAPVINNNTESSVFLPDCSMNLSSLEVSEREIESFKRFEFYFEPPQHKPKVQLDVSDIAASMRHNQK